MIIFVHGMGHNDDIFYWKAWAAPLKAKLAEKGLSLNDDKFGGVYYYDLVPGPAGKIEERIQVQLLSLKEDAMNVLSLSRTPFPKGFEIISKLANHIVDNFGDIFSYLYIDETHKKVNERVYEAVAKSTGPVVLIGYSLGSIVGYCALKQDRQAAKKVAHLIMVGSPLFWFRQGVSERAGLESGPDVGRFTNIAGVLDIAWPQAVPRILRELDNNMEFTINSMDPIEGHRKYFYKEEALDVIASEIRNWWAI